MNFDIALFLVVLSALSGVIWLLDILVLAQKRQAQSEQTGIKIKEPFYVDYARSLFPVFFIVLVLRSFLFEPFRIPSQSMMPTLWVGDFILVNKFAYGVRLPVLNTEIIDSGKPERGDVAVFRYPKDPAINYIKRVIGIPGDHIVYNNKLLTVNGVKVPEKFLGRYVGQGSGTEMNNALYQEEDLTGVKHKVLVRQQARDYTMQYHPELSKGQIIDFSVPEGQYYVMGDNRDNSNDSRYWGTVPVDNLVGKAFFIWFSWDAGHAFFWKRIGTSIE
jgi:signal peptidase I